MERKPIPREPLLQRTRQKLAGQMILEGRHEVVSVADQQTPPVDARPHLLLKPPVQQDGRDEP